ncbi:MAG: LL-diaminopimelate aminotransferase [Lachnospiraceae bacterium]|jgi:LL-diaminopimelate aminotransferase|nr:LL-diaminopimelate aminotransferase [Lachnospiraceae bacterium]MEE3461269.1 LL-diaminopimelate aminotransferase [Lachnospiraceae bacterium]
MVKVNENYKNLKESYLFAGIANKVNEFQAANPEAPLIRLGIGDVTLPLCGSVIKGMQAAVSDMSKKETFHGYGPEQGYDFLKNKLKDYYKKTKDVLLKEDEIFISDGAKSDVANFLDLFDRDNTVCVPDPVYPVYVDTNIMHGRKIIYVNANKDNGFLPMPGDGLKADLIYICSPNNPTGAAYTRDQLKVWVDYANKKGSIILFDAAYEAFITDPDVPGSIFEIDGARTCAVEFCSFSKTAGFTGTRCGYTVVPDELERGGMHLRKMWLRRQTTKFNGTAYIVQRGAEEVFTADGLLQNEIKDNIEYYKDNAKIIMNTLDELGIFYTGGKNSPYIWMQCPDNMKSWDFFDLLLKEAFVVGTPGEGFGVNGEGFFRLTSFNDHENTAEAMARVKKLVAKL